MLPPAGSIAVVPAYSSVLWRWQGSKDSLHIYLEPSLVELDPTRTDSAATPEALILQSNFTGCLRFWRSALDCSTKK